MPGYLLPGFGAVNVRALRESLAGAEPAFLSGLKFSPQSLVQVIAPDIRMHWWSDGRRYDRELGRVSRKVSVRDSLESLAKQSARHEERLFDKGRLAPPGFLKSRIGRWVTFEAPKSARKDLEKSGLERFWDLTAAALSGGFDPEPAAALLHMSVSESGHWITGPQALGIPKLLEEALRGAGAEFAAGCPVRVSTEASTVRTTLSSKEEISSGAALLGLSEPDGFPAGRSLKDQITRSVSFVFRAPAGALDPAIGPRAIWYRSHESENRESGPRVLWIGREALSEREERIVISIRRIATSQPAGQTDGLPADPLDKRLALTVLGYLAEISPGIERLAAVDTVVADSRTAWLPPELPGVEKPKVAKGIFRMDIALAGSFGSGLELAQARDLARWFELPRKRTD